MEIGGKMSGGGKGWGLMFTQFSAWTHFNSKGASLPACHPGLVILILVFRTYRVIVFHRRQTAWSTDLPWSWRSFWNNSHSRWWRLPDILRSWIYHVVMARSHWGFTWWCWAEGRGEEAPAPPSYHPACPPCPCLSPSITTIPGSLLHHRQHQH